MNNPVQLDNYKAPPLVTGSTYTWNDLQYSLIKKLGNGQRRECWKAQVGSEFRAILKEPFNKNDVDDLIHFRKVISILNGHANVVKTHTTFWSIIQNTYTFFIIQDCFTNCIVYLINELHFCNNTSEVHSVFLQLAEGLDYVHRRGVTINDISLDNIFYSIENNRAVVAYGDLGGADIEGAPSPTSVRNPVYASPSRLLDDKRTKSDDVYSLGLCVSAIQWDYTKGEILLPYEEFEKMPNPRNINVCMKNFKNKLESNCLKPLLLEMMADARDERPTAASLLSRVKAL